MAAFHTPIDGVDVNFVRDCAGASRTSSVGEMAGP
jgi:hypothetical protein